MESGSEARRNGDGDPGREVLLTGGTGFIGKVILESLLGQREALGIRKVHLLVRPSLGQDVRQRFDRELLPSRCFEGLAPGWAEHVEVVSGDLARPGCGLSEPDRLRLSERVSHVIHAAAAVEFDLPLARAVTENVTASQNLLALARACPRMEGMASLSTAYVTPHESDHTPIEEALVPLPRPAAELARLALDGDVDEAALLAETGQPNTYTLSKCIAEHVLSEQKGDVPLTFVRPSIVSAAWQKPSPGWIDSYAAFAAFVVTIGAGQLRAVAAIPSAGLDLVPCDEVARLTVEACLTDPAERGGPARIRHAVAGRERACSIELISGVVTDYFGRHPLGEGPRLRHVGPDGPGFRVKEWIHHRARLSGAALWQQLTRRPGRGRGAASLADRLIYLNRIFPYFTHRTFDFRASRPLAAEGFEPREYVERVCEGIYTLMRQGSLVRPARRRQARGSDGQSASTAPTPPTP